MKKFQRQILDGINRDVKLHKDTNGIETDFISDGWHTFGELYDFRLAYNALAFNLMWTNEERLRACDAPDNKLTLVHKSWKHNDGEWCFGEEKKWFIVAAKLPTGVITNHYKAEHWDLFKIPEVPQSIFQFDGHTAKDALERIFNFLKQ